MKNIILGSLICLSYLANGQTVPYGNNPSAGKYIEIEGTQLYYEIYGSGSPLLLLHGDTFGYIDEFTQYIPLLSEHFKVIAIGMRGHGKSELGTDSLSYQQFAEDAIAILTQEHHDTSYVMGFSAGAITAYYLAAYFPDEIKKVVAIGGMIAPSGYREGTLDQLNKLSGKDFENMLPDLVASRKQLMPATHTYGQLIAALKKSWLQSVYMEKEKVVNIKCPVLNIGGDRDEYIDPLELTRTHQLIPNSQLAIIPHCGHVGLILNPMIVNAYIIPFLNH